MKNLATIVTVLVFVLGSVGAQANCGISGDINGDGQFDINDVNDLCSSVGTNIYATPAYDTNGNGVLDLAEFQAIMDVNGFYPADMTLDGSVDGQDFVLWNAHKFETGTLYTEGDVTCDSSTDGQDFVLWNSLKFTSHPGAACPDPTCDDLANVNFMGGSGSPMPLGAAVINGECRNIFGNEIPAGISLFANVAECEINCAGCVDNSDCLADEYCFFTDYTCGSAGFGTCELKAAVCAQIYDPVCTCDFTIASSACHASQAGQSIQFEGECAQEDVCTYSGGTWNTVAGECDCPAGTEYNYQRGCQLI